MASVVVFRYDHTRAPLYCVPAPVRTTCGQSIGVPINPGIPPHRELGLPLAYGMSVSDPPEQVTNSCNLNSRRDDKVDYVAFDFKKKNGRWELPNYSEVFTKPTDGDLKQCGVVH
ncbi:hypothetical protein WCLP8_1700004 [uncultured Gammaproteobacteria bacterium]